MLLGLRDGDGWHYISKTLMPSKDWMQVTTIRTFTSATTTFALLPYSSSATFWMSKFTMVEQEFPYQPVEVTGKAFEAEEFRPTEVGKDPQASKGRCAVGPLGYSLGEYPFPRTSVPVYVYCRARRSGESEQYLHIYGISKAAPGATDLRAEIRVPEKDKWVWAKSPAMPVRSDAFSLSSRGSGDGGLLRVDAVVISTYGNLRSDQLDQILADESAAVNLSV